MVPVKFKKLADKAQSVFKKLPDFDVSLDPDIPEGLEPLGDTGLWANNQEPADPTDCDAYPSSPWCGGIPISFSPLALDPTVVINPCYIGIQFNPVLAFIKLPQFNLGWVNPACAAGFLPKPEDPDVPEEAKVDFPPGDPFKYVTAFVSGTESYLPAKGEWLSINCPAEPIMEYVYDDAAGGLILKPVVYSHSGLAKYTFPIAEGTGVGYRQEVIATRPHDFSARYKGVDIFRTFIPGIGGNGGASILVGRYIDVQNFIQERLSIVNNYVGIDINVKAKVDKVFTDGCLPLVPDYPPPPPPPKQCCMSCCPTKNDDDALLKLLLQKVNKLSKVVGVNEYPASLPASLITEDEGFLGNLIPNPPATIPNLTQLVAQQIKYFDEVMGQFEIAIEVKDSDATTPGDQPKGFKLPNVAETLAEMFGLLIEISTNSEVLVNATIRTLFEAGQDKQQNFVSYKLLQSLVDYMGYGIDEKKVKLPMNFTPGKTQLDQILQEVDIDVSVPELNEKMNLQADLVRFREAASIIKSVYFKKVNPYGNVKEQVMQQIKDARDLAKKINKDTEEEFEKFIEETEKGFIQTPGIYDNIKPYGRDYSKRPKIRDLSNPDSGSDDP
jgi:hypothetical protein